LEKHEVLLKWSKSEEENFEKKGENLATVWVIGPGGERIKDNNIKVQMFLSKDALIGLGTELIRLAYNFREGRHWHLEPMSKDNIVQTMGVYLTPDSEELIICCDDLGILSDYRK